MSTSHSRGELLIQRRLLKYGIQFDPRQARTGIHLVAFVPKTGEHLTVRVMACQKPIPAGGKGASSVGWLLPNKSVADLVAVTKLDGDKAWLFRRKEFEDTAQQKPKKPDGKFHLYFYIDPERLSDDGPHERDFAKFVFECRMHDIFGI
jgi:hypothetical protein